MLVLGLLPLASLLLVAEEVELNATVSAETRAGQAPFRAGEDPEASAFFQLTPMGDLSVRRSDLEFRLEYGPRIFYRYPNEAGRERPLLMHVGNLTLTSRLTPTTTFFSGANVTAGEVDYTTLQQVVGMGQSLPPVAQILVATARAGIDVQATRLWRLGLAVDGGHRRPLDDQPEQQPGTAVNLGLQPQTNLGVAPNATVRLGREDDLSFAAAGAYRWFESGRSFLSITPQTGWRHRLSATDEFRLSGGVTYSYVNYPEEGTTPASTQSIVFPVGSAEVIGLLMRHRGIGVQGSAGTMVDFFVDPVLRQQQKRLSLTARILLLLGDRWTAGIETAMGTTLEPLEAIPPSTIPPDVTYVSVSLPVRHRLNQSTILEFGGRWADRAPHTSGDFFGFHQRQLWVYASLTATTRDVPRWGLPDSGDTERLSRRPARTPRPDGEAQPSTSTTVSSRATARATDRATDRVMGDATDRITGTTPTTTPVPGQQTADGRSSFDDEDEDLEPERDRQLPNESQLPIGIGGIR